MAEYINREDLKFIEIPIAPVLQGEQVHYEQGILKEWLESVHTADVIEIPKGATNGDMIKVMFPNFQINEEWKATRRFELRTDCTEITGIATNDWWNAPYKRGSYE